MRRLNRISHRSRYIRREPPKPRWYRPAMLALKIGAALATTAVAVTILIVSGIAAKTQERVFASVVQFTSSQGMTIEEVISEGRLRTDFDDIQDILVPLHGQNTLMVDIDQVAQTIEALPWVDEVAIKRLLPSKLYVSMREYRPYALWRRPSGTVLVSSTGEIINVTDLSAFMDLRVLSGEGAPERAAELFEALESDSRLARRVTGAQLVSGRRWNVFVDGKITVRLPEFEPAQAWQRLASIERSENVLSKVIQGIDLRLPERLILRLVDDVMPQNLGQPA